MNVSMPQSECTAIFKRGDISVKEMSGKCLISYLDPWLWNRNQSFQSQRLYQSPLLYPHLHHQIPIICSHLNGLKLSSNRKVVINTASAPDGLEGGWWLWLFNPSIDSRILSFSRECGKSHRKSPKAGCSLVQQPNTYTKSNVGKMKGNSSLPATQRQVRAWDSFFFFFFGL